VLISFLPQWEQRTRRARYTRRSISKRPVTRPPRGLAARHASNARAVEHDGQNPADTFTPVIGEAVLIEFWRCDTLVPR
jgi:hypothetical protein